MEKQKIWEEVLLRIREKTTETSFRTWFRPASLVEIDEKTKTAWILISEKFYASILKNRYLRTIEEAFEEVTGSPYRILIRTPEEMKAEEQKKPEAPKTAAEPSSGNAPAGSPAFQTGSAGKDPSSKKNALSQQRIFNPKYNFDNFVVGNSNKFAHAAAKAVAESPSQAYNPLFIYGGSGLGKTHLIHAIGIYLLEHNPDLDVLYVSSEMFTNEMIKSIQDGNSREFRNKYRRVDVLLVDDIQFLEGKEATQEEFFNTFNTLYDMHKQIVISSDRPPGELTKLEERLRSRFAWNLIASLSPADYETRVAILMKWAENAKLEITPEIYDVICLIAERITDNIRELEGAFNTVYSFSKLMHENINVNFASRILKDIAVTGDTSITPEKIKAAVSRYYHIKPADLESSTRQKNIAYPRQIAMYLCRSMTDYSFERIGGIFGGRHYSTVMHACDKIQKDLLNSSLDPAVIDELKKKIQE